MQWTFTLLLTDKFVKRPWSIVVFDKYEVDGKASSDDGQRNEALRSIVKQREHDEEQHHEKKADRQQQVHL